MEHIAIFQILLGGLSSKHVKIAVEQVESMTCQGINFSLYSVFIIIE